jgi:hypothetical protein
MNSFLMELGTLERAIAGKGGLATIPEDIEVVR